MTARKLGFLSLLLVCLTTSAVKADPVAIPGSRVQMEPPPGFEPADRFQGFASLETGASIMVTEMPTGAKQMLANMTAAELRKGGMTLLDRDDRAFDGLDGAMVRIAQNAQGQEWLKQMAVFGDEKTTYMVVASYPKDSDEELVAAITTSLTGLQVSDAPANPEEALLFQLTPSGDMKLAMAMSGTAMYSKGGVRVGKNHSAPAFVVGPAATAGLVQLERTAAFAETRLKQTATIRDIAVRETAALDVDGLSGFETTASAIDDDSSAELFVYQALLFDEKGYFLMQGIGRRADEKRYLPIFKQMSRSFKLK
jgi:hypothetical protein